MRGFLTGTMLAAALFAAIPAHAHDERRGGGRHGERYGHESRHYGGRHDFRREHYGHRYWAPPRREVRNRYYGYRAPVAVAPGVHIVLPNIFLPFP